MTRLLCNTIGGEKKKAFSRAQIACDHMCRRQYLFFTSNPNVVKHDPLLRVILSPSRDHNVHLNGFTGCHILV